jgi:predicted nucleic acid-binding protein
MNGTAIFNASPLIVLTNAGHSQLIEAIQGRRLVPDAVVREVEALGPADPAVALVRSSRFEIVQAPAVPDEVSRFQLGSGELSVIALGSQTPDANLILDDLAARRAATSLRLTVHGTLWLAVEARRLGIVPLLKPVVEDLQNSGLFLSPILVQEALEAVGE